jgi:Fe-coproporphyrin III synthase
MKRDAGHPARQPGRSPDPDGLDGLVFILDERCDSRCIMCDYWRISSPRRLTPSEVVGFWRRRVKIPPRFVTLTGGEPLLYPDLFQLAAFLKGKVPNLVLSTNGSLLEQYALQVAEHFDKVIISLDGARLDTHRIIRGRDTFAQALRGADELRRHGRDLRLTFKMVVQKRNFRELSAYVRLALDHAADGVAVAVPDLFSGGFVRFPDLLDRKMRTLMLSAEECGEFEAAIRQLQEEFPSDWLADFIVEGNLIRFLEYFRHHAGLVGGLSPRRCSQGAQRLIVNGKGEVKPCFFLEPIGHLDDLEEGDFYSSQKAVRFRTGFDPRSNPTCRQCAQFLDWRF